MISVQKKNQTLFCAKKELECHSKKLIKLPNVQHQKWRRIPKLELYGYLTALSTIKYDVTNV